MNDETEGYRIVVSVGTDHHPFNRLVEWVDWTLETWPSGLVPRCLVQHGASRAPRIADGVLRMPRDELLEYYRQADVVVVQGGPGSILDAREVGRIPLVVARKPELGEVVDDHQAEFSKVMASRGDAILVDNQSDFFREFSRMMSEPGAYRTSPRIAAPEHAADQLASYATAMFAKRASRMPRLRRVGHIMRMTKR